MTGLEFSIVEISFLEGKTIVLLYDYRKDPMIDGKSGAENIMFIKRDNIFNVRLSEEVNMNDNVTVFFSALFLVLFGLFSPFFSSFKVPVHTFVSESSPAPDYFLRRTYGLVLYFILIFSSTFLH